MTKNFIKKLVVEIKDAVAILKLDKIKMVAVSQRETATFHSFIFLFFPVVVNLILFSITFRGGFLGSMFSKFLIWPLLIPVLALIASIFGMSYLAVKHFKLPQDHVGLFRVISYASVVSWLSIVPYLLYLLGIMEPTGLYNLISVASFVWAFVVAYHYFFEYKGLTKENAGMVVLAGIIGSFIAEALLGAILVGDSYRLLF